MTREPTIRVLFFAAIAFAVLASLGVPGALAESGETRVRSDLERYLQARVGSGDVSIEYPSLASFGIDSGRVSGDLRTELSTRAEAPFRGRVPITVELYAGDQLVRRGVISPYVQIVERVVVPARDLRRGDVLTPEDLSHAEVDGARLQPDTVREIDLAVGQRMRRSVRQGKPLRLSQIEGVPVVERGDRVLLVLESGSLRIQATGRAQEAGAVGELIRVLNVDSKREITGRVDQEGAVHVAF